jgi:negative regulator of flagellin synthesis FlgM
MSDPISNNARIANPAANRSTAAKLDAKPSAGKSDSAVEAKSSPPPAAPGADTVNLSKISQRIKEAPDFDRAKVESIKAALREGNYPINPRRIAENFVALEKMI